MLITLKTLQQQTFKIDIDEEETVRVETMHLKKGVEWELDMSWNRVLQFFEYLKSGDICVKNTENS